MANRLEAHEHPISKVLCSDFDFEIPRYQRPYSWETTQAAELLDDLATAAQGTPDQPYFLGSIVLIKPREGTTSEVIDGQQRLTTLTILLAVLRELSTDDGVTRDLDGLVREPGSTLRRIAPKPRLALRERDRDFFRRHVQEPGGLPTLVAERRPVIENDAQAALRDNAALYWSTLSTWDEDRRRGLAELVMSQTYLVVVTTPDEASAHRIFAVMNDRGLDLLPTDVFKAKVIGEIGADHEDRYTTRWEDAEQTLGRESFASLFPHIRMIFARQRAQRELLEEFPRQVLSHFVGCEREFVDEVLVPYAEAFDVVLRQGYRSISHAEQVNAWLRRLTLLDNYDWQPPALWALRNHPTEPDWLAEFLRRLERLAASMLIRRFSPSDRQIRYGALLRELDAGDGLDASDLDLRAEEQASALELLDGDVYRQTRVRRYVLLRLDELVADNPGVAWDQKIITVEHVLPQNPPENSEWRGLFDDSQRERWTHRLANLVLLNRTKNAQAQNYDFARKKDLYFAGRGGVPLFALTVGVMHEDAWTPELLQRRQREQLGLLAKAWDLSS